MKCALFVPGNQANMHLSAYAYGADTIIFDCEDSVALNQKDSARILVSESLKALSMFDTETMVRVNGVDTEYFKADVDMAYEAKADYIMLPKASIESVKTLDDYLLVLEAGNEYKMKVFLIVESALGVETLWESVNVSDRIVGLLLGGEDLMSDMHVMPTIERQEIFYARAKVASVARAKNILALDTPYVDVGNDDGLKVDAHQAKQLGYDGKVAIHPGQIDTINEVFSFTDKQIHDAQALVLAYEEAQAQGLGAFSYQGKMVDKPILERALYILEKSKLK